jgi:hypothetical protein
VTSKREKLTPLLQTWSDAWPLALADWSRFTKLSTPRWCFTVEEEKKEGLSGSFAMIRLTDQAVVVSLQQVAAQKLDRFARQVLAHEIGHHIYVPGSLLDQGRLIARIRRGLPDREQYAPLVANLYADLLINDRLQRQTGLDMAAVYQALHIEEVSPLWQFYMRTYEILWSLPTGTLIPQIKDATLEAESHLAARIVRSFAKDWLEGAGRYAVLCLRYLLQEQVFDLKNCILRNFGGWGDTIQSGHGGAVVPAGLIDLDPNEARGILHPMFDPELSGMELDGEGWDVIGKQEGTTELGGANGQCREPFEYGQILRALGMDLSDHDIAVRYYRERAIPYLVRFPQKILPRSVDPLPEGLDVWDTSEPLERVDWLESVLASPTVVPGVTTRQRLWGDATGCDPETRPIDLDLYIDCSGSMPNPQRVFSPIALAGAIVALSALRVGSAVQATLWSGPGQFETTNGFVRDPVQVLRIVTGYLGGSTAFPLHILRDTYKARKATDRAVHLLNVSDDGVTTMFDQDEFATSGWDISAMAMRQSKGGATMVLNYRGDWQRDEQLVRASREGWDIFTVTRIDELIPFAREFSRRRYAQEEPSQ